jgi:N-acetylmuramoyl-L-alanine amidase
MARAFAAALVGGFLALATPVAGQEAWRLSAFEMRPNHAELAFEVPSRTRTRIFTLDAPPRVVADFEGAVLPDLAGALPPGPGPVRGVRSGMFRPGWSRLVLDLAAPMRVAAAGFAEEDGRLRFRLRLVPTSPAAFAAAAAAPETALRLAPGNPDPTPPARKPGDPMIVAIDPGHGGIDPGATREGLIEKEIALAISLRLAALLGEGRYRVLLTREADVFVPLRERVRIAQANRADLFLSIHVNTEASGLAEGVSVFSLSQSPSDAAAERLAEFENGADVMAGLAFDAADAEVARILLEYAQGDTNNRSQRLARALVARLGGSAGLLRGNPHRAAGFEVLKAPEVPSLLIELGFLSNEADRARLASPEWVDHLARDILAALDAWRAEEAALDAAGRR